MGLLRKNMNDKKYEAQIENGHATIPKEEKQLLDEHQKPEHDNVMYLDEFNPPDGGWGWVVCIASFWTNGTVFGILNTFGILYVKMLDEFDNGDKNLAFKICE